MIDKLKYLFLTIALISVVALGVIIFGSNSPNLFLVKVFGVACFIGIFGNSICVLIDVLKELNK